MGLSEGLILRPGFTYRCGGFCVHHLRPLCPDSYLKKETIPNFSKVARELPGRAKALF